MVTSYSWYACPNLAKNSDKLGRNCWICWVYCVAFSNSKDPWSLVGPGRHQVSSGVMVRIAKVKLGVKALLNTDSEADSLVPPLSSVYHAYFFCIPSLFPLCHPCIFPVLPMHFLCVLPLLLLNFFRHFLAIIIYFLEFIRLFPPIFSSIFLHSLIFSTALSQYFSFALIPLYFS